MGRYKRRCHGYYSMIKTYNNVYEMLIWDGVARKVPSRIIVIETKRIDIKNPICFMYCSSKIQHEYIC